MSPYEASIRLSWHPPIASGGNSKAVEFSIGEEIYRRAFAPLPRDREIPFAVGARERAARMEQMRRAVIREIAQDLAEKLVKMVDSNDPQHGYSPEEWEKMNEKS